MRLLITGGTGLLGKALIDSALPAMEITATFLGEYDINGSERVKYEKLDIRDAAGYAGLFKQFRPDVVIHAASIGSPDFAEKNKELTWEINVNGTKMIASLCKRHGAKMIYISSNGIYDGNNAPYGEDDKAEPINYYGVTKLEGEKMTRSFGDDCAIVRPILMYGNNHPFERQNIVTMAIEKLKKNEKMSVYDDVFSNALLSESCAKAIISVIEGGHSGDFNIAGAERVSIYGLVKKAAEIYGLDPSLIMPVKQGFFNELVPRPKDTSYRTEKMEKVLGVKPLTIIEGLKIMRAEH